MVVSHCVCWCREISSKVPNGHLIFLSGKWICDPHRIAKQKCLIYSIGSNGDVSFEQAIREEVSKDCEIHTFDIDNPDGDFEAKLKQIGAKFHKVGLGSARHVESDPKNFKTLKQIVKMLGHQRRTIEVFKIDCENVSEHVTSTRCASAFAVLTQYQSTAV
jgi:hypothetical protein